MGDTEFQIVLLSSLDCNPEMGEPQDVIAQQYILQTTETIHQAIQSLGYPSKEITVQGSIEDLRKQLYSLSSDNTFIFNICDGYNGASIGAARIVKVVEELGFKHTGSTSEAIELCTDKALAKQRLIQYKIPTPDFQVFDRPAGKIQINFPAIVKPVAEDASMGIGLPSVVSSPKELYQRVGYVIEHYNQPALVEEFIPGRELAVSLWGNEEVEVLPIAEEDYAIIHDPLKRLLTYESKWIPESYFYQNIFVSTPADLSHQDQEIVEEISIAAYKAISLRDLGRLDIRYYQGIPYIIDINDIPDLSVGSGFPNSAAAAGWSYTEMVERILDFALRREGWR